MAAPATTPFRTVSELLGAHHRTLDALFDRTCQLAQEGDFAGAANQFADFDRGLRRHIHVEEAMLFPAFERSTGLGSTGPTQVMRFEHARIKEVLEEIGQLLATSEGIAGPAGDLREVLGAHNGKEEMMLYPMSDRSIEPAALGDLLAEMDRFLKG